MFFWHIQLVSSVGFDSKRHRIKFTRDFTEKNVSFKIINKIDNEEQPRLEEKVELSQEHSSNGVLNSSAKFQGMSLYVQPSNKDEDRNKSWTG